MALQTANVGSLACSRSGGVAGSYGQAVTTTRAPGCGVGKGKNTVLTQPRRVVSPQTQRVRSVATTAVAVEARLSGFAGKGCHSLPGVGTVTWTTLAVINRVFLTDEVVVTPTPGGVR
jgi:hypothetical protein